MTKPKKPRGDFAADRRLVLLTAIAVPIGLTCTLVARLLTMLIDFFTNLFFRLDPSIAPGAPALTWGAWTILVPAVGGLIIGLMARYGSERIRGHGIPEALEAILFGKSIMQPKVAILKPLSSAISIGSGGPFGAEGPIIMTGGAFGSILAQRFSLTSAERKTLLVAGAAAGMAAIFGTPMAAVLLAIELLLFEWRPRSLVPVAIASAVAAGLRPYVLSGSLPLFPIPPVPAATALTLAAAVPMGLACGLMAWAISTILYKMEDAFHKLPFHWSWWPALGGLAVGIGGYIEPRALGVGYDVIRQFLTGTTPPAHVASLVGVKALIWVIALASGTSGGVLAPLLIMGAGAGALGSALLPGPAHMWALVGMGAVMGGMMRSPFTSIIFALELTDDINALPVLMVGSITAYAVTVLLMPRSILTEKVARRGFDIFREYGVDPLDRMRIKEVMTKTVVTLRGSLPLVDALKTFETASRKHRGYPVLDDDGTILGVVTATDALAWRDLSSHAATTVGDVLTKTPIVAHPHESCRIAAERMANEGIGRLPVVSIDSPPRLVGMLTRSDLLKARARSAEEENRRERRPRKVEEPV